MWWRLWMWRDAVLEVRGCGRGGRQWWRWMWVFWLRNSYSSSTMLQKPATLDDLRFINYKKQVNRKKLTSASGLELRALPPTSDSPKYQSYRSYHQVQKWLGNDNDPTVWGYVRDTYLIPVVKDKAAAPDKILKLISCGCKQGCTDKTCVCVKAGMFCTILFSGCNGRDCTNVENVIEPDETD